MASLRAKKPEAVTKRLKMFMFGPAGVGKTTAAIQFPQSYILDAERGTENYDRVISDSGSVVFQSSNCDEVTTEIKTLLQVRHEFRTVVIDPITTMYDDLLQKCELKVGSEFGRHYGEANKYMKRLQNLITALDMNVVVTAHAKAEYGQNLAKTGYTFDGWKKLDYIFDLVVELTKKGKKRYGRVVKSRIGTFEDDETFEWSYAEVKRRYELFAGPGILDREAATVELASPEQIAELRELLNIVRLPDDTVEKWFDKAKVDRWEDMPATTVAKCIEHVRGKMAAAKAERTIEPVGA